MESFPEWIAVIDTSCLHFWSFGSEFNFNSFTSLFAPVIQLEIFEQKPTILNGKGFCFEPTENFHIFLFQIVILILTKIPYNIFGRIESENYGFCVWPP